MIPGALVLSLGHGHIGHIVTHYFLKSILWEKIRFNKCTVKVRKEGSTKNFKFIDPWV